MSKENSSSNMNQFFDQNYINICDDDVPNIFEPSIDKADVEDGTHITDEISEANLSKPTQIMSINPQTEKAGATSLCTDNYISILSADDLRVGSSNNSAQRTQITYEISEADLSKPTQIKSTNPGTEKAGASYVCTDNYISILSADDLRVSSSNNSAQSTQITGKLKVADISKQTQSMPINPQTEEASYLPINNYINILSIEELSKVDISKKNKAMSIKLSSTGISKQTKTSRGSDAGISEQNIYEDMIDKAYLGVVSTNDSNTHISRSDQLHQTSPCKSINTKKRIQPCIMINKYKLALTLPVGLIITVVVISLMVWGVTSRAQENINAKPAINLISTSPENQKRPGIGFTALATSVVRYSTGTTLIFNGMDEEHNGFDRSTGLFTCPKTSIYYAYVTLRKNDLDNIYVDVFKMDTRIIRFSENHTGNPWNTVSNSALVSCSMGEIIQMKGWSSGSIYGEANVRCSSFSVINVGQIAQNTPNQTLVGYSGYANSQSLSGKENKRINFPNPICNVGNHFSSYKFTCPYRGIYFVSVTYWKYPSVSHSYRVSAVLQKNWTTILKLFDPENPYNYITNNALVRCNTGEYIHNGRAEGKDLYLYGSGSYPESIFTVMSLIQEDPSQPFIGFSRCKDAQQDFSAGDVISFPRIITDDKNYLRTNRFFCPVEGSYYFLLNLRKKDHNIEVDLKHGDQTVFKLEDTQSNRYNMISNSAVIRCLQGEVVKVVAEAKGRLDGSWHSHYTSFSGFLLYNN